MIFILPITKIFDKTYACNLVYRLELAFSYLKICAQCRVVRCWQPTDIIRGWGSYKRAIYSVNKESHTQVVF